MYVMKYDKIPNSWVFTHPILYVLLQSLLASLDSIDFQCSKTIFLDAVCEKPPVLFSTFVGIIAKMSSNSLGSG